MPPSISVIIPVYNVEAYLKRCLDSVLAQDYQNFEVICVNDGSTDGSARILQKYVDAYHNKIQIITQKNGGLSNARNTGLSRAKGEWITFVDSDDYIAKNTLSCAVKNINPQTDLVCWQALAVPEGNIPWINITNSHAKIRFSGNKIFSFRIAKKTPVTVWNKLFKTSIIREHSINFPSNLLFEDNAFYWKYFPYCKRASFIQQNLYFYTQRKNSIMGKVFSNTLPPKGDGCKVAMDIIDFYKKNNLFNKYEKELQKLFLGLFFLDFDHVEQVNQKRIIQKARVAFLSTGFSSVLPYSKAILKENISFLNQHSCITWFQRVFSIQNESGYKVMYLFGKKYRIFKKGVTNEK